MSRSIFFSSYIVPPLQKPTGQGQTPQPSPSAFGAFRCHGNRCKTCPFITLFSLPTNMTNKDAYDITSPALLLLLVHMIQCTKCNVQYIGESKRHLSDGFDEHRQKSSYDNTLINQPCFRSLYPSCQFYGQHRTRSSRKDHLK